MSDTPLTNALKGKVIDWVGTDEEHLVLGCVGGIEVKVKWGDDGPYFAGQNVRIILPTVDAAGEAQPLGK